MRWSARRKQEVVLRLLRGEELDALARETGQAAGTIASWREDFLSAGQEGLKARPAPVDDRRLADAQRKIGELSMDLDIAKALLDEVDRCASAPSACTTTITVTVPDTLWATDATEAHTRHDGRCAVFAIVDHATGEAWVDASARMDRWAAADLLREVCAERFGSVDRAVAAGLALRYDGGPCFRAAHYQAEIDFLGIARSPAYHYEPETNGCVEKFIGTLKEQVLWIERFDTLDELRARIRQFAADYNQRWLLARHGYRTPSQARDALHQAAMA